MDSIIFDIFSGEAYFKTIAKANIDCDASGTKIYSFKVPSGYQAVIRKIATSSDAVTIDIQVNGQTVGDKYGVPYDARAIALFANGMDVGIIVDEGKDVDIYGRGVGGTVTLNAISIVVVFKRKS